MLEELSYIEIDRQHPELLPTRTVMSMFMTGGGGAGTSNQGAETGQSTDALTSVLKPAKDFLALFGLKS